MNIDAFKAQMVTGGYRPNQFDISLVLPPTVAGAANAAVAARFMAKSASLPQSSVGVADIKYRGRSVKFGGEREFHPWQISVYTDNDFLIRNSLEDWVSQIQNNATTNGLLLPLSYQTDMSVQAYDRNGVLANTYTFHNAFPTEVGAIQLDWENNNQIATFDVTFDYDYWV